MKDLLARLSPAHRFYAATTLGFFAQVFLIWCWGSETPMNAIKLLAFIAPAVITWSWNYINNAHHWDVVHHVVGRLSLYWFFPCLAGLLTCTATTVWLPLTMVPMIYMASMALWKMHMPCCEISHKSE